jgi:hypothetical protein
MPGQRWSCVLARLIDGPGDLVSTSRQFPKGPQPPLADRPLGVLCDHAERSAHVSVHRDRFGFPIVTERESPVIARRRTRSPEAASTSLAFRVSRGMIDADVERLHIDAPLLSPIKCRCRTTR